MTASDEEIQAKREEVDSLREQVVEAEAERAERERALTNDMHMADLMAEQARLEAQLASAQNAASETTVNYPLQAAQSAMEVAQQQQEAENAAAEARQAQADAPQEPVQPGLYNAADDPSRTPDGADPNAPASDTPTDPDKENI